MAKQTDRLMPDFLLEELESAKKRVRDAQEAHWATKEESEKHRRIAEGEQAIVSALETLQRYYASPGPEQEKVDQPEVR